MQVSGTSPRLVLSYNDNILSLGTLVTLYYSKFDSLLLFERSKSITTNRAEMNKNVIATITGDKAESLIAIKPFHCPGFTIFQSGSPPIIKNRICNYFEIKK